MMLKRVFFIVLVLVFVSFFIAMKEKNLVAVSNANIGVKSTELYLEIDTKMVGEFVKILPGEFQMGESRKIEILKNFYNDNERPLHKVTINQSFEIGKYEVTQEQWELVMGYNFSHFKENKLLPVEQVTFEEVKSFISKLNSMSNKYVYRLPTEAEWEYTCRAGSIGDYAGNLDEMAWYISNSEEKTHPVGNKQPNAWGIYDMHGNVWEWCSDCYEEYSNKININSKENNSDCRRVVRGGGWDNNTKSCRSASRSFFPIGYRNRNIGIRLVRNQR